MTPDAVAGTGAQCILANTYHLMLRPGPGPSPLRFGPCPGFARPRLFLVPARASPVPASCHRKI